jgi:hypothetical protein
MPDSVTTIGEGAFGDCRSLTSVTIPNNATLVWNSAFSGCTALASVVIPSNVTTIGNYAFIYCSSLASVVITGNLISIGNEAFAYCSALRSIDIPNSVTTIGDSAFHGCSSLVSIAIPDSVTTIGYGAFVACRALVTVTSPISTEGIVSNVNFAEASPQFVLIYYDGAELVTASEVIGRVTVDITNSVPIEGVIAGTVAGGSDIHVFNTGGNTRQFERGSNGIVYITTGGTLGLTLTVNKDSSLYTAHGRTFTLSTSNIVDTATNTGIGPDGTVAFTSILDGTYYIFDGIGYTSVSVTFSGSSQTATVDYYTLTYDANGGTPTPNAKVILGGRAYGTLPVQPADIDNAGYYLAGWANAATGGSSISSTTPITAETTIYAQWGQYPTILPVHTITAISDLGSTIDPNGSVIVNPGGSRTFTYSAEPGYVIVSVLVDGINVSDAIATGFYIFYDVQENHYISIITAPDSGLLYIIVDIVGGEGTPKFHLISASEYTRFARNQSIDLDSDVLVSVDVADGYRFVNWTGEVSSTDIELHFPDVKRTIYLVAHLEGNGTGTGDEGDWSPLNLIAAILALAVGIAALIAGRDRGRNGDGEKRSKLSLALRVGSIIIGAISIILFFVTEDLTGSITSIDGWTLPMFILFLISTVVALLSFRFDKDGQRGAQ